MDTLVIVVPFLILAWVIWWGRREDNRQSAYRANIAAADARYLERLHRIDQTNGNRIGIYDVVLIAQRHHPEAGAPLSGLHDRRTIPGSPETVKAILETHDDPTEAGQALLRWLIPLMRDAGYMEDRHA